MGKYDHLIYEFAKTETHWGDFMPTHQAYFRGRDCMEEANFYASYRCYMKEAFLDRDSNYHSEEEVLSFLGYDMADPFGSFDAEIRFSIGPDLEHMEEHIITEPTAVRVPAFWWHCPLEFRRVTKPVYFQVVHLRGKFANFYFQQQSDGSKPLVYTGVSFSRQCVEDPTKKCTWCGKCFSQFMNARNAADAAQSGK